MLRLSEAMRLGAMLRPQAFGGLYEDGGSCAVGAALEAVARKAVHNFYHVWPWVKDQQPGVKCPEGCRVLTFTGRLAPPSATDFIIHLNDHHMWPREKIADWIATIEPPEEQPVENTKKEEVTACC